MQGVRWFAWGVRGGIFGICMRGVGGWMCYEVDVCVITESYVADVDHSYVWNWISYEWPIVSLNIHRIRHENTRLQKHSFGETVSLLFSIAIFATFK